MGTHKELSHLARRRRSRLWALGPVLDSPLAWVPLPAFLAGTGCLPTCGLQGSFVCRTIFVVTAERVAVAEAIAASAAAPVATARAAGIRGRSPVSSSS